MDHRQSLKDTIMRTTIHGMMTILALVTLVGCGEKDRSEPPQGRPEGAGANPAVVEATSYPLAYVTERLGTPVVTVRFRAAGSGDPAYWNPAPTDITAMQQADLIVLNGASYESWLKNVTLPSSRLVDTSAGFADRWIPLENATTHSHGPEGEHEHTGTAFTTWLDPTLLAAQAQTVAEALTRRWPEHESLLRDRARELTAELDALDQEIRDAVGEAASRPVVFSHPVYQYLERRYGLHGASVHWEPDQMPNPAQWEEFAQTLKSHPAKWMVWESAPMPAVERRLAEMGVGSAVVRPCGDRPDAGDLLDVMRENVKALRFVYGGTGP